MTVVVLASSGLLSEPHPPRPLSIQGAVPRPGPGPSGCPSRPPSQAALAAPVTGGQGLRGHGGRSPDRPGRCRWRGRPVGCEARDPRWRDHRRWARRPGCQGLLALGAAMCLPPRPLHAVGPGARPWPRPPRLRRLSRCPEAALGSPEPPAPDSDSSLSLFLS